MYGIAHKVKRVVSFLQVLQVIYEDAIVVVDRPWLWHLRCTHEIFLSEI